MKSIIFIFSFLLTISAFAAPDTTAPTKAATPLPTIEETQNSDVVLTERAQLTLTKIPLLKGQAVSAASHEGVVTLEGSVDNKAQEQTAIQAVKKIKGVKGVISQLTIKLIANPVTK